MLEHFPFTNATSQWLFADSIPALVDFHRNRRVIRLAASGLTTYVCAGAITQQRLATPLSRALQKLPINKSPFILGTNYGVHPYIMFNKNFV